MTAPATEPRTARSGSSLTPDAARAPGHRKDFQPGFSPVLIECATKQQLAAFRTDRFGSDSNIERNLITAAVRLVLDDQTRHEAWLRLTAELCREDVLRTSAARSGHTQRQP